MVVWSTPEPVSTGLEKRKSLAPARIRTPDHAALRHSTGYSLPASGTSGGFVLMKEVFGSKAVGRIFGLERLEVTGTGENRIMNRYVFFLNSSK